MEAEQLAQWVMGFPYPAVFLLLLACGVGAPLSEELILLTAGGVVAHGQGALGVMMLTAYLGTLAGDLTLYRIGRKVGPRALDHPGLKRLLTPARAAWVERHFERNGLLTVFMVRFLPGLRAATYLMAGVGRLRMSGFLLADAAAALISVPLVIWLGFRFGVAALEGLQAASHWLLAGVGVMVAGLSLGKALARRWRARERGAARKAPRKLRRDRGRDRPRAACP